MEGTTSGGLLERIPLRITRSRRILQELESSEVVKLGIQIIHGKTCAGIGLSLVTGQPFRPKMLISTEFFNSDRYTLDECILIEAGLDVGKRWMTEFEESEAVLGR
jgi:hypothetical protein